MAPSSWNRMLLFPEQSEIRSAPMWDRPAAGGFISLMPMAAPSPMWNREPTSMPIFEEAVESPSHMWSRASTGAPVCPCCVTPTARRPSSATASATASARPSISRSSMKSLRSMPSSLGLRIKQSFASLRKRPSTSSLWI